MGKMVEVNVTVNIDDTIEELRHIIRDIEELGDLVPEWSQMEAEDLQQDAYNRLSNLIDSKCAK